MILLYVGYTEAVVVRVRVDLPTSISAMSGKVL